MIINLKNPSYKDFCKAVDKIYNTLTPEDSSKLIFEFSEDVEIMLLTSKIKRRKIALKVFKTQNSDWGYSNRSNCRHGLFLRWLPYEKVVSISKSARVDDWNVEANKLKGRFHDNLWDDLKEKLNGDYLQNNLYKNTSVVNISNKFPRYVMENLKEAIENKKNFSYKQNGEKRDLSVSVSLGEDGILRAWYSSEYHGYCNGDYWILVNPTTAMFKETD